MREDQGLHQISQFVPPARFIDQSSIEFAVRALGRAR